MGVLEALGGWQNVNQEKLEQIKVDNPPLYSAISKALNLLAKKFGGEDIIIQKPIEVVDKKPTTIRMESDYAFLKRMEILTLTKVNAVTSNNIVRSIMDEVGLEDDISLLNNFISYVQEKLDDLEALDLVSRVAGSIYTITNAGQEYINSYELQNKQVEGIGPSDEDLKLEMLLRMADYYDGGDYKLLSQDDLTTNAVKHQFDIPRNKFFGIVVKLLSDRLVETDPSKNTDSIRLTNKGYDKAMNWFQENLPEDGPFEVNPNEEEPSENLDVPYLRMIKKLKGEKGDWVTIEDIVKEKGVPNMLTKQEYIDAQNTILDDLEKRGLVVRVRNEYNVSPKGQDLLALNPEVEPSEPQLTDLQISILEAVQEASATKIGDGFVSINEISGYIREMMPKNYSVYQDDLTPTSPSLQQDLDLLYAQGYLEFRFASIGIKGYTYRLSQQGKDVLDGLKTQSQPSQYNLPQHRMEGILKQLSEVISKVHDYVTISELYRQLYDVIVPITYTEYGLSGEPTLEKDLQVMEGMGLVKSQTTSFGREYYIDTKGSELLTQLKFEEAQKQKASSLRPSPSESATIYPVGTKRFGNDGNEWRVTETKNGVKRWTKVGEIPSDEPEVSQEPPISEITEDEVDLDLLEQQLNDDSLEFDLNEEDLDNLEF
jgi:predicted transcriptional regulator